MTARGSTGWDNDARRDRVRVGFAMASLMCLPVVVCNLGVEMLYILEQRLRAQSVPEEKAVKVLHDVVTAMFDPAFVDELFKPQPAYTQRSMRRIMDKLAHSSIMRLSESSMDKLYDLVTMGLKYQLVTCREPEEIPDGDPVPPRHPQELPHRPQSDVHDRRRRGGAPRHLRRLPQGWVARASSDALPIPRRQADQSQSLPAREPAERRRARQTPRAHRQRARPRSRRHRHAPRPTSGARETTRLDVRFDVKSTPPHRVPPGGNMYAKVRRSPRAPFAAATAVSSGRDTARDRGGGGGAPRARRDRRLETEGVVVVVVGDFERRGGAS